MNEVITTSAVFPVIGALVGLFVGFFLTGMMNTEGRGLPIMVTTIAGAIGGIAIKAGGYSPDWLSTFF